jgi:RNA polymerase sigma-70 factor (ECF subfamily)
VDRCIAGLPERQRLALSLVYFEGLSNIEAAAVLEVSVDALESLLSRARRGLKDGLSSEWRELLDGLAETGQ